MPRVVLITGVSRFLGARVAAELAERDDVDRVVGVDTVPPESPAAQTGPSFGRVEFVRADIGNPLIGKVLGQARVDTVVHTAPHARLRTPTSRSRHQLVTGTMQLLAGCQSAPLVRRIVLASTTAVYGSGAGNPAAFTEAMAPLSTRGHAREAAEAESHVRGFARRRPDLDVVVLRLADLVGPAVDSALTRYLALPVIPTSLGYDPRLQLLHEDDAVAALVRAALDGPAGTVNVAGAGVVTLSQAARWAARLRAPVPAPAIALAGALARASGVVDVSADEAGFLSYGRVVDTTRLREHFGFVPAYTTAQALRAHLDARARGSRPLAGLLDRAERTLAARALAVLGASS